MAGLTQYYTASSIDGFITDEHESLDWLLSRDVDDEGPMAYPGFRSAVGAMAMGASTYAWIRSNHDEPWDYTLPCWVFTHREFPAPDDGDIRFTQEPVAEVHRQMAEAAQGRNLWIVGGGDLVGQFADAGLLDEVWVQYAPVSLGAGAPLLPRRIELRLEELASNREFACARWSVVRRPAADRSDGA
jgi:dihydrofolate reductase